MANSGLARMAKRALTRLDAQIREEVEVYQGQVFIWDRKGFEALHPKCFGTLNGPKHCSQHVLGPKKGPDHAYKTFREKKNREVGPV